MSTRLIVIRHGQTDWNIQSRLQGHTDIPLNEAGARQVACLAPALQHEALTHVYSSDLGRALATAQAFAQPLGLPVLQDLGLRERGFGVMEGSTYREIDDRWPDWSARWRAREPDFAPPQGETLQDFYARSVACATRLAQAHEGGCIALVTHGGVLDCLYRAATHVALNTQRSWQLDNAAINRLLFTGHGFSLIGWNDQQHLDAVAVQHG